MPQTRKIGSRPPAAGHRLSRPMCAASPPHAATKGTLGVVHTAYSIFSLEGLETLSTFGVYVAFVTGLWACLRGTASSICYFCIALDVSPVSSLVHTSRGRRVSSRRPLLGVTSCSHVRHAHYLARPGLLCPAGAAANGSNPAHVLFRNSGFFNLHTPADADMYRMYDLKQAYAGEVLRAIVASERMWCGRFCCRVFELSTYVGDR